MKRSEEVSLEIVAKEAAGSILTDNEGMAPFDAPALIIRPGFEHNRFADEPLRIIGSAVRLAIAAVIRDTTMIPDNLDNFFARACRRTFDRLKMAPVRNYVDGSPFPCDLYSGHFIEQGFDTIRDLGVTTEFAVPVNRLIPFVSDGEDEKSLIYPKVFGMNQLLELEKSMPAHRESFALQTFLKNIIHTFIDFTQEIINISKQDHLDNQEFRNSIVTLRLEFLTKIGRFHRDLSYGEFFDPDNEEAIMLEYIQSRLKEILEDTKQYILSQE